MFEARNLCVIQTALDEFQDGASAVIGCNRWVDRSLECLLGFVVFFTLVHWLVARWFGWATCYLFEFVVLMFDPMNFENGVNS